MDVFKPNNEFKDFVNVERPLLPEEVEKQSVEKLLKEEMYVPQKKEKFSNEDMSALERKNAEIDALISKIETGELKYNASEMKKEQLEARKGRNISQIMLNSTKVFGDSDEMDSLKKALKALERNMGGYKNSKEMTEVAYNNICGCYTDAINECTKYIASKNPWLPTGKKRMRRVKATLAQLKKEMQQIDYSWEVYSKHKEEKTGDAKEHPINNGVALLQYGRLAQVIDKEMIQKETSEKERLENRLAAARAEFEAAKAFADTDYDKLEAEKSKAKEEEKKKAEEAKKVEGAKEEKKEEEGGIFSTFLSWFSPVVAEDDELKKAREERDKKRQQVGYDDKLRKIWELSDSLRDLEWKASERKKNKENEDEKEKKNTQIKQKELINDIDGKIKYLPGTLKDIVRILITSGAPSEMFKGKKLKEEDKKIIENMVALKNTLSGFKNGEVASEELFIDGSFTRIFQDEFGNLEIRVGRNKVPLPFKRKDMCAALSKDIVFNPDVYGEEAVYDVIFNQPAELKDMDAAELINTREYAAEILHQKLGVNKGELNNLHVKELRKYAVQLCVYGENKAVFEKIRSEIERSNAKKDTQINSALNQELHEVVGYTQSVVLPENINQEDEGWTSDQLKVRDFLADLFYARDTWITENDKLTTEGKLKEIIKKNAEAVAIILSEEFKEDPLRKNRNKEKNAVAVKKPSILDTMFESLPMFQFAGGGEGDGLKKLIQDNMSKICDMVYDTIVGDEVVDENSSKINMLKSPALLTLGIQGNADKMPEEALTDLGKTLDQIVDKSMTEIQSKFDECVDKLFSMDDDEEEAAVVQEGDVWIPMVMLELDQVEEKIKPYEDQIAKRKAEMQEQLEAARESEKKLEDMIANGAFDTNNEDDKKTLEQIKTYCVDMHLKVVALEEKEKALDEDIKVNGIPRNLKSERDKILGEIRKLDSAGVNCSDYLIEKYKGIIQEQKEKKKEQDGAPINTEEDQFKRQQKEYEDWLEFYNKTLPDMKKTTEDPEKLEDIDRQIKVLEGKINEKRKVIQEGIKRQHLNEINKRMDRRQKNLYNSKAVDKVLMLQDAFNHQVEGFYERVRKGELTKNAIKESKVTIKRNTKINEEGIKQAKAKAEAEELVQILGDSVKGKKGQGLFMKNVLKTYFTGMPASEQRAMVAAAVRNCKNKNAAAGKVDDEEIMGEILGGMFKGAGPLFQKMLQGIPTTNLAPSLKKAISDTQDSLAPISDEVVKNHMDSIIKRSNGKITKIKVVESLGAASVGQAFLCKVYGPFNQEGKNVVIKLLRPDVRARMEREKEIMLKAAKMTDRAGLSPAEIKEMDDNHRIGGMEATYLGNLKRIEEELDLNIEAENCKKGTIYENKIEGSTQINLCHSMELSDLAEPSSDSCIMEIAGTKTLKKYVSDIYEKIAKLEKYCETEIDDYGNKVFKKKDNKFVFKRRLTEDEILEYESLRKELQEDYLDAQQKQTGLLQLSEKWVTEGIYNSGYYHGDLHAGNIMVGNDGVTVIDFGNATQLDKEQQKHIIRMMAAAALGEAEMFQESFHALLVNTPEEVYQAKSEEFTAALKEIFSMGDAAATGERIAVALVKAQELGLELPPVVANFSSGQIRLQNTVNEMNKLLKDIRSSCSLLLHTKVNMNSEKASVDLVYESMHRGLSADQARDAKEKMKNHIEKYELVKKEDFLTYLKAFVDGKDFCEKYKISKSLKGERERLNNILQGKEYFTYQEENYINHGDFSEAFPGLCEYIENSQDEGQKKLMKGVFDHVLKMVHERISIKDKEMEGLGGYLVMRAQNQNTLMEEGIVGHERLCIKVDTSDGKQEDKHFDTVDDIIAYLKETDAEGIKDWKDATRFIPEKDENRGGLYEDAMKFFEDKKGNRKLDETFDSRAEKLWETYEKEYLENANKDAVVLRGQYLDAVSNIFPIHSDGTVGDNLEKKFALWSDTIKNITDMETDNGFIKECEKMKALYEKCINDKYYAQRNAKSIYSKFKKFSVAMLDNAIYAVKVHVQILEQKHLDKSKYDGDFEPKNFLSVMGDVIDKHIGRTFMQLGLVGNYKARKMVNMQGAENDS